MVESFQEAIDKLLTVCKYSKYFRWYIELCSVGYERGLSGRYGSEGFEHHHVLPKSIFNNGFVVKLTQREHFIAHKLLTKMVHLKQHRRAMFYALSAFTMGRSLSSKQYEVARKAASIANSDRVLSDETKRKLSEIRKGKPAHNKGKPGKKTPCSKEKALRISESRRQTVKLKCEFCEKESDPGNHKKWHGQNCKNRRKYEQQRSSQKEND